MALRCGICESIAGKEFIEMKVGKMTAQIRHWIDREDLEYRTYIAYIGIYRLLIIL